MPLPTASLTRLLPIALAASWLLGPTAAWASHYPLSEIPTLVSAEQAKKLEGAGIKTSEDLLGKVADPKERGSLAKSSGLPAKELLRLGQRADLLRIKGVGPEMVLLLEAGGVKTTRDLGTKDPAKLDAALKKANTPKAGGKPLSEKPPTVEQLGFWIQEAKQLPAVLKGK